MIPDITAAEAIIGFIVLNVGAFAGFLKWGLPKYRKARSTGRAVVATLVGTDEIRNPITNELIHPAQPGVGVRMSNQERTTELLAVTVTKLVDQGQHQLVIESRVDDLLDRVVKLEEATVERIVNRADSAAAWRAMEAAANAEPPIDIDDIDHN